MANEVTITIIGSLTTDPELRYMPSGIAVANFTVANNSRVFDKSTGEWRDGDPLYLRCQVWRETAENVAECLKKGTRVIAVGRFQQRSYKDRLGETRTVFELIVDEIGPSLKWATATITGTNREES